MYYNTDAELKEYVKLIENLGYVIDKLFRLRLSTARVYSFEAFLKSYIRESKQIVKYAKKYAPRSSKFEKWFVENETQILMNCKKIPDLSIGFHDETGLFIVPIETKRIATSDVRMQLISYLYCAMEYNSRICHSKANDLQIILVSYFSKIPSGALTNIGDQIEIFKPVLKLDVDVLKKINKIVNTILNEPSKIKKEIHKIIKKTKNNIEKLIILGVVLFIGTKMPEIVSNVDVVQTTTKAVIDELLKIPEENIMEDIDALPSDIISHLPPRLIPYLNEKQLRHLTPEQIRHLSPEQLKSLTFEQILTIFEDVSSELKQMPPEIQNKLKEMAKKILES